MTKQTKRILSLILVFSMILSMAACSSEPSNAGLSDPNPHVYTENVETETLVTEAILTEFITSEIYLEELILVEDKITELLLKEETIDDVLLCKTIYVPQEHIEEFSKNSQTAKLFGDGVSILPLLKKISFEAGVIVTLVVLKKAGIPDPIAGVVAAVTKYLLNFDKVKSLLGGVTGAAYEIDHAGGLSAVIGFAAAAAGLIIAIIGLEKASGIELVLAGISLIEAAKGTVDAGYHAVKTLTSTDSADIDWDNIDWEQVGVSAAQQAIQYGADGYMWGSIIGTVNEGMEIYGYYHKYSTPYTAYKDRWAQTPTSGNGGHWNGARGESEFVLDDPIELANGTKITNVTYHNAVPDFSPYQEAQVDIHRMTNSRSENSAQADEALAKYWTRMKHGGKTWTAHDVESYRIENDLTWHEMSNMESTQLVPLEVDQVFSHYGGVDEYNAMIGHG